MDLVVLSEPCLISEFAVRDHNDALLFARDLAVTGKNLFDVRVATVAELAFVGARDSLLRLATGPAHALAGPLLQDLGDVADAADDESAARCLDVPSALSVVGRSAANGCRREYQG